MKEWSSGTHQRLRQAYNDYDSGKLNAVQFKSAVQKVRTADALRGAYRRECKRASAFLLPAHRRPSRCRISV